MNMHTEIRRSAAATALSMTLAHVADLDALCAILASTPVQSADDRPDDLCAIFVRGPLSHADVMRIEGKSDAEIAPWVAMYGDMLASPRTWTHSWLRRRVRRSGAEVVLSREDWIRENARAILRAGGVEVRTWDGPWIRIAPAVIDYAAIAMSAADAA